MRLNGWDWTMLALYGLLSVAVGLAVTRRASQGRAEFFLQGAVAWGLSPVAALLEHAA